MYRNLVVSVLALGALVGILSPRGDEVKDKPQLLAAVAPAAPPVPATDTVIQRNSDGHFYVDAQVNDQTVHFLVDTGASGVALTGADAARLGLNVLPGELQPVARGASGQVMGKFTTIHHIQIDQKQAFDVPGIVVPDGLEVSLLGQSYLSQIGSLSIANDRMTLR